MLEFDGQKLKKLRQDRKLKQRDLGLLVGKDAANIASYENGIGKPPADTLLNLMTFFQVSVKELSRPSESANV